MAVGLYGPHGETVTQHVDEEWRQEHERVWLPDQSEGVKTVQEMQ